MWVRISFKSTSVSLFYLTHLAHIGKNKPSSYLPVGREGGREVEMGSKRSAQNLNTEAIALEHRDGACTEADG